MKIIFISRFFPYIGGRESVVLSLADYLSRDHDVAVITPDIGRKSSQYQVFPYSPDTVVSVINDFKPDIINFHAFYLINDLIIDYCREKDIKTVLTLHGDLFNFGSEKDKEFFKSASKKIDRIVAVCQQGMDAMEENGTKKDKLDLIYNGVNVEIFKDYLLNKKALRSAL